MWVSERDDPVVHAHHGALLTSLTAAAIKLRARAGELRITLDPHAATLLSHAKEVRDYLVTWGGRQLVHESLAPGHFPLARYGLTSSLFDVPTFLNEAQPEGTMDVWAGDECLTLRILA